MRRLQYAARCGLGRKVCWAYTRKATQRPRWASTRVEGTRDRGTAPLYALAPAGLWGTGMGVGMGSGEGGRPVHTEGRRGVWGRVG